MAPKRSAPAPPPPPPPPAASSEETASGSGSEEEDEEEIAYSPPPGAPKTTAPPPPPQKGQVSEDSDEYEDDEEDEEEEEEKANHVAPPPAPKTTAPPPPQKGQVSEDSDEYEDDDEEEEEEKTNHVAHPPAAKNPSPPPPPPPPPNREESEASGDEEEDETDDEAPQPKPAPNQEVEGKGAKPSSGEDKKQGAYFQRTWSTDDEVRILEAMAAYRREHGAPPQPEALLAALAGSLDNSGCNLAVLQGKVKSLKRRYSLAAKRGEVPSKDHDRRLFDLSKSVWGSLAVAANGGARREIGEMCKLYPYLAEEVREVEKAYPGLFKREFEMIGDDKAHTLNEKIKKQRQVQMRVHNRHHALIKEVTKTLMELAE